MNEEKSHYQFYRSLIRMGLEETSIDTSEYQTFHKKFPHLAESIRLKREIKKFKQELKSLEKRSTRLQIQRKIRALETRLRRETILKRLHGENKQEIRFNIHLKRETLLENVSSLSNILGKRYSGIRSFDRSLRKSLRKRLPPVVSDLGSLDMTEKSMAVREWIQKR